MAGWDSLERLLQEEIKQRAEEGCDVSGFKQRLEASPKDKTSLDALYDELMALAPDARFPHNEPSDLEGIKALRPTGAPFAAAADIDFGFFYGAWLGRCCGCALGKPVEAGPFMGGKDGVPGWKLVYEWFKGAGAYPITGYTPAQSDAAARYGIEIRNGGSVRENIKFMESDDDIRYTVVGLILLEQKGLDWDAWDVGKLWHARLPYNFVCTAETQAYLNFALVTQHGYGAKPADARAVIDWVNTYRNPYREWIGAQIRVDAYAYCAAGNPELAAELAWRDASLSHVKNGVYGAMFCAAMIAAAFVEKDTRGIIEAGLAQIPQTCRLYKDVRTAMAIADAASDELDLVSKIWDAFSHYSPVHAINNSALCAASLLYAGDDFEKAIATSVLGGWDTDCNGATVGSIMGAKLGAKALPAHWTAPLNDTLYSAVVGFDPIPISECARRSYELYKKHR